MSQKCKTREQINTATNRDKKRSLYQYHYYIYLCAKKVQFSTIWIETLHDQEFNPDRRRQKAKLLPKLQRRLDIVSNV